MTNGFPDLSTANKYIDDRHTGFEQVRCPFCRPFPTAHHQFEAARLLGVPYVFSRSGQLVPARPYQRHNDVIPAGDYMITGLDAFPNIVIVNNLNVQLGPTRLRRRRGSSTPTS
jgi:hypothetical protein